MFVELQALGSAKLSIAGRVTIANQIVVFSAAEVENFSDPINLSLRPFNSPDQSSVGVLRIRESAPNNIEGDWETDAGGKGVFRLTRMRSNISPIAKSVYDEELIASSVTLGPIELFRSDVVALIEKIQSFFSNSLSGNLVMSTDEGYKEARSQFVSVFMKSASLPSNVSNLKLQLTDTSATIHKLAIVEFNKNGTTTILVQSGDRIWTHGAREAIETYLRRKESWFKKIIFNDNYSVNALIFTIAIIFLPDMTLPQRSIYAASTRDTRGCPLGAEAP